MRLLLLTKKRRPKTNIDLDHMFVETRDMVAILFFENVPDWKMKGDLWLHPFCYDEEAELNHFYNSA